MQTAAIIKRGAVPAVTQFGDYAVHEQLGVGGMATVHRAEVRNAKGKSRPVALKRLLPHLAREDEAVTAFVHEAKLASHLRHENVVQTIDYGKVDGQYFIAMEYIAGPTLLQIMQQCANAAGAMPLEVAVNILIQILDGLDHAHNLCDANQRPLGIIHRDVSPANIIVGHTGCVKLIDFGVAKVNASQRTKAGIVKGKFAYIAPEYTLGRLDQRADLFGVGVIAHELLTGRPLFQGSNDLSTVERLREMPIKPPSRWNTHVTLDLDDIVMTALHRDPDQRWQSAKAMRNALANFAQNQKLAIVHKPVIGWVTWAFSQKPRKDDSVLARVIDTLDEPSISLFPSTQAINFFVDPDPELTVPGKLAAATPVPVPIRAHHPSTGIVVTVGQRKHRTVDVISALIGLMILAGLGVLSAAYYLGLPIDL